MRLKPGIFLIPDLSSYSYCLRVDRVTPWEPGCWWPEDQTHIQCTRFDINAHGEPQKTNPGRNHIRLVSRVDGFTWTDSDSESLTAFVRQSELSL